MKYVLSEYICFPRTKVKRDLFSAFQSANKSDYTDHEKINRKEVHSNHTKVTKFLTVGPRSECEIFPSQRLYKCSFVLNKNRVEKVTF